MTARQHHYVPQCYLKGFAADREKPKLFTVDYRTRSCFSTHPRNVAAERDFHRIEVEGQKPDALESAFAVFEGELAPALCRIADSQSIENDEDRNYLFNLMALIAGKNPRRREAFRSFHECVAKMIMDMATSSPERWEAQIRRAKRDGFVAEDADADYKKMRDFIEADEYKIETTTDYHLSLELPSIDTLLQLIARREWIVFKARPGSPGFITSDNPMCLMWSDPKRRREWGATRPPGYGLRETQIAFPVSKEMAILGAFETEPGTVIEATDLQIAKFNGSVFLHSNHQVYAQNSDFSYILAHHDRIMPGSDLLNDQCFANRKAAED